MSGAGSSPLLCVRSLQTKFLGSDGPFTAVDRISLDVGRGETLAIVGESGSGKSVTALSILRLVPHPEGRITAGEVIFDGADLLRMSPEAMRQIRGDRIAMIFQDPMSSLNPVFTIGDQIAEALICHRGMTKRAARTRAIEMLRRVNIPSPEQRVDEYPHRLSGGMRQRAMIAMALSCQPDLLIADEPTTALDVTIQAQILELLKQLQAENRMAMILITHDLGIVRDYADTVVVMYAGKIVERGNVKEVFARPAHPYTQALIAIVDRLETGDGGPLRPIPGSPPRAREHRSGCDYFARCEERDEGCRRQTPQLITGVAGRAVACFHRSGASPAGKACS